MGWTSYYPATLTAGGRISRKAEIDRLYNWSDAAKTVRVLKSRMVGTTYYAAVEITLNETNEKSVAGVVALTSVRRGEFFYKTISEDMGPNESKCPKAILDLLTPTESEYALAWRERCRKNILK